MTETDKLLERIRGVAHGDFRLEGILAARKGIPKKLCPYAPATVARRMWLEGFSREKGPDTPRP